MGKKTEVCEAFECRLVSFLIDEYFDGDVGRFARQVQSPKAQVEAWLAGRKPQRGSLRWLLSATVAPEFKVAAEFAPVDIDSRDGIRSAVRGALRGHDDQSGVYAFYDSMCNVIYVGKASSGFLQEIYQQLRSPLGVTFPKAVKHAPEERWQVVRYISAYEVPEVEHLDYARHVEALVLRLSKPVGNKVLGRLNIAVPPKEVTQARGR